MALISTVRCAVTGVAGAKRFIVTAVEIAAIKWP